MEYYNINDIYVVSVLDGAFYKYYLCKIENNKYIELFTNTKIEENIETISELNEFYNIFYFDAPHNVIYTKKELLEIIYFINKATLLVRLTNEQHRDFLKDNQLYKYSQLADEDNQKKYDNVFETFKSTIDNMTKEEKIEYMKKMGIVFKENKTLKKENRDC